MTKEEEALLKILFYGAGGEFFEVIDDDGIRKPVIRTRLSDINHGIEAWTVEINWRLFNKCQPRSKGNGEA